MATKSRFGKWINYPQIKALLWKDLLIKKRQPVSIYLLLILSLSCELTRCYFIIYNRSGWQLYSFYGLAWYFWQFMHYDWNSVLMMLKSANSRRESFQRRKAFCHFSNLTFAPLEMNVPARKTIRKSLNSKKHRKWTYFSFFAINTQFSFFFRWQNHTNSEYCSSVPKWW